MSNIIGIKGEISLDLFKLDQDDQLFDKIRLKSCLKLKFLCAKILKENKECCEVNLPNDIQHLILHYNQPWKVDPDWKDCVERYINILHLDFPITLSFELISHFEIKENEYMICVRCGRKFLDLLKEGFKIICFNESEEEIVCMDKHMDKHFLSDFEYKCHNNIQSDNSKCEKCSIIFYANKLCQISYVFERTMF